MVPIILRECACGVTSFVLAGTVFFFCLFFLCRGSGDITCVSAEQRQEKSYQLHALLIETAFPDTYAALLEPVLFARVRYNLSLPVFKKKKKKISSAPTHVDLILQMQ